MRKVRHELYLKAGNVWKSFVYFFLVSEQTLLFRSTVQERRLPPSATDRASEKPSIHPRKLKVIDAESVEDVQIPVGEKSVLQEAG